MSLWPFVLHLTGELHSHKRTSLDDNIVSLFFAQASCVCHPRYATARTVLAVPQSRRPRTGTGVPSRFSWTEPSWRNPSLRRQFKHLDRDGQPRHDGQALGHLLFCPGPLNIDVVLHRARQRRHRAARPVARERSRQLRIFAGSARSTTAAGASGTFSGRCTRNRTSYGIQSVQTDAALFEMVKCCRGARECLWGERMKTWRRSLMACWARQ